MFYQPSTQTYFATYSDIKNALNVSFADNVTDAELAELGVYPLVEIPPAYDPITENLERATPSYDAETQQWVQNWSVTPATPEEIATRQAAAREANKQQATQLMLDTDWTELPSVTNTSLSPHLANEAEFVTYRVALRAIAVDPPVTVESWPMRPAEQWA